MFLFSPDLPGSFSARISSRLPLSLGRAVASCFWAVFYLADARRLRSTIFPSVRRATGHSRLACFMIGLRSAMAFGRYLADFAFFLYQPVHVIARRVETRTRFRRLDNLVNALAGGKGTILVSSNFSCFYYALTTARAGKLPPDLEVAVVQPYYSVNGSEALKFKEKISKLIGCELKIIESGTLRAGIEMNGVLRRGGVVACLIDFFPPNASSFAVTEFLNAPSCQPTGLSAIAQKNSTPIVPCFTFYEKGQYVTEFAAPIHPAGAGVAADEAILSCCTEIDRSLSSVVLSRPAEWASWISVPQKWNTANALLAEMEA